MGQKTVCFLERANRIIICEDDEKNGWSIFWTLNKYYRISGRIDLRSSWKVPEISYFGANEDIYTPQQIIRTDLNKAASDVIAVYVYQQGIERAKYSYSTAVGLFNTVINIILLLLVNRMAGRISDETSFI